MNRQRWIGCLFAAGLLALSGQTGDLRAEEFQAEDAQPAAPVFKKNWFQQSRADTCGGASAFCIIFFDRVPAGKLVTVSNVSCTFRGVGLGLKTIKLTVAKKDRALTTVALRPVAVALNQVFATRNFAVNDDVTVYASGGEDVIVSSEAVGDASSIGTLNCHIAGALK